MWAHPRSDDEELLLESLRRQLRRTEENLQSVGAELSRCVSGCESGLPLVVCIGCTECNRLLSFLLCFALGCSS